MKTRVIIVSIFIFSVFISDPCISQMTWNQACNFAGTNSSYITVRNTSTNNITGSFTLEAWVHPTIFNGFSKGVISKGGVLGLTKNYAMRLQSTGRFDIYTNGALRLTSKTSVPLNQWSHIAAVYNSATSQFSLYLNGALDTSAIKPGSLNPVSNTDSVYVGIAGTNTPFVGMLDEVRIWNRALSIIDIIRNMRVSLGTNGGYYYNGLIMSLTFQNQTSNAPFSMIDFSGIGNHGHNVGVTASDMSDKPSQTIAPNLCIDLSFGSDYLSAPDHPGLSPANAVTLQAWIYPRSDFDRPLIHKGPKEGGVATNYSLNIIGKKLAAKINGGTYVSNDTIPLNKWTHVAFTYYYDGLLNYNAFYVNGNRAGSGFGFGGSNITNGSDSLYIGGTGYMTSFNGFIDEVRISPYSKSQQDINDSLYTPLEYGFPYTNTVAYNFDGYTWCNTLAAPFLNMRNSPVFANPSIYNEYPVSPLNRSESISFQKGFYMKKADRRIPGSGTSGFMTDDTLDIALDENINDINVYVALNHKDISTLRLWLVGPNLSSVPLSHSKSLVANSDHIVTVFDEQASDPVLSNRYVSFSPSIRPEGTLSIFNGTQSKGKWRLTIEDLSGSDTGRLYSWGVQVNNKYELPKILSAKFLLQGFYDPVANSMTGDTVRCYLRTPYNPFNIIDSSRAFVKSDGSASFVFFSPNVLKNVPYAVQIMHRNSIETWSNLSGTAFAFNTSQANFDFTSDSSQAYANNQIQVDVSPVEFAIYGCDVVKDGLVNLNDMTEVYNKSVVFLTGYNNSDVTGDNITNLTDIILTFNNASAFVQKITP